MDSSNRTARDERIWDNDSNDGAHQEVEANWEVLNGGDWRDQSRLRAEDVRSVRAEDVSPPCLSRSTEG